MGGRRGTRERKKQKDRNKSEEQGGKESEIKNVSRHWDKIT